MDTILRFFDAPDEVRHFEKGTFEIVRVGGLSIGRATYRPGWKWSHDVGSEPGTPFCEVEHVGTVLSGHAVSSFLHGSVAELVPGTIFYIPPAPHDSWVVGNEAYVSLHFMGADHYAT